MAHTFCALHYHFVYSTKNRQPWLRPEVEERVWSYRAAVAKDHGMTAHQVGGVDDHIHVLISAPPTMSPSDAVKLLKGATSRWIHKTFDDMGDFAWQAGYAAMTLSREDLPRVKRYISRQRVHHSKMTFEEELAIFLKRNGIKTDVD